MKKNFRKIISIVLAFAMLLSMATIVSASATEDNILLDLDMNTELVEGTDYVDLDLNSGPTYAEKAAGDKYLTAAGIIQFPLKKTSDSKELSISFDAYSTANGTGGNFWLEINDTQTDIKGFIETVNQLAGWANWLFEINLETSKMDVYKNGVIYADDADTRTSLIGKTATSIIIYSYPEFSIDNLLVKDTFDDTEIGGDVTGGTILDLKMDASEGWGEANLSDVNGINGTYYTFAKGRKDFEFNKAISTGKYVIEYDLKYKNEGDKAMWTSLLMNGGEADIQEIDIADDYDKWIHYKHVVNMDDGTAVTYKGNATVGTTAEIAGFKSGFSTSTIRFTFNSGTACIDNLSVKEDIGGGDSGNDDETDDSAILDLKMDASEGWDEANLSDVNGINGTYYTFAKGRKDFEFNKAISTGKYVIEYDLKYKNEGDKAMWTSLLMNGGEADIQEIDIAADYDKWIHYKHVVNMDDGTAVTYKGDATVGTTAEIAGFKSGFSTSTIRFTFNSGTACIDNLLVKEYSETPEIVVEKTECVGIEVDGTTAKAVFNLSKAENKTKVLCYIASYNGDDILVNANCEKREYTVPKDDVIEVELDVKDTYTKIRAFLWDDELVPLIPDYPAN